MTTANRTARGGKKKSLKARDWCVTIPFEDMGLDQLSALMQDRGWLWIASHERGSSSTERNPDGYEHWQLYFSAPNAVHFTALKKVFPSSAHLEPRRGSVADAVNYCMKMDATHVGGPYGNKPEDFKGWKPEGQAEPHTPSEKKRDAVRRAIRSGMSFDKLLSDDYLATIAFGMQKWAIDALFEQQANQGARNVTVVWVEANDVFEVSNSARIWLSKRFGSQWGEWKLDESLGVDKLQSGLTPATRAVLLSCPASINSSTLDVLRLLVAESPMQVPRRWGETFWAGWSLVVIVATNSPEVLNIAGQNGKFITGRISSWGKIASECPGTDAARFNELLDKAAVEGGLRFLKHFLGARELTSHTADELADNDRFLPLSWDGYPVFDNVKSHVDVLRSGGDA
ncbi:hypothetical protein [Bifidobacterium panos]|uniref:CRESS-DNA virus Rep endonuclease domain-containing protein n=1 Tax=Bifidobacterium panos TaxID=2675321 RepID=A0ABX1SXI7_9BIFI|nr:hypothetical protein [Bifidobacterium sp. DSM 109963]NMN01481.1 hypothetical protein [Bifidobacterium sp. DSM 109963]